MTTHLIIGNGAAGLEAAVTIRKQDPASLVTMISEDPWLPYFRPKLVHFLAEDHPGESLLTHDQAWYDNNGIKTISGTRIQTIDPAARIATDHKGGVHHWDKLLIATGSVPFVPPIPGTKRHGVSTLRSIEDCQRIKELAKPARRVVVIGGGLLGLESAYSLHKLGKKVTVVETAPWLLPRQLDADGGAHLQRLLEAQGLEFLLGDQAIELEGEGETGPVRGVRLKTGTLLDADVVLFSIGIRPDIAWLANGSIATNRGVVVDDRMATSQSGIWAAGDVCEYKGTCQGLWMSAREQGRIAGINMAGGDAVFQAMPPSSQLKITGIDVFSAGEFGPPGTDGPTIGEKVLSSPDPEFYRKLIMNQAGGVKGIMVIGDKAAIMTARKVLAGTLKPEDFLL